MFGWLGRIFIFQEIVDSIISPTVTRREIRSSLPEKSVARQVDDKIKEIEIQVQERVRVKQPDHRSAVVNQLRQVIGPQVSRDLHGRPEALELTEVVNVGKGGPGDLGRMIFRKAAPKCATCFRQGSRLAGPAKGRYCPTCGRPLSVSGPILGHPLLYPAILRLINKGDSLSEQAAKAKPKL